jgi:hypothetical protein
MVSLVETMRDSYIVASEDSYIVQHRLRGATPADWPQRPLSDSAFIAHRSGRFDVARLRLVSEP